MITLPLHMRDGHLFIDLNGELWLLDTGAPTSFGTTSTIRLAEARFQIESNYLGLTPATLSRFVGVQCVGLLGTNVLGRFDIVLDVPSGTIAISEDELTHTGQVVPLDEFMTIPIVSTRIRGVDCRMFFDTGAQISYYQDTSLAEFPPAGIVTDFYPGVGQFETKTHSIDISIGTVGFTLRCGSLPGILGATLMMANVDGIIGNQVLCERVVGYFPRRHVLVL